MDKDKDSMKRYILTGAPGCGKTTILRQFEADGHSVVEEAATDVIALDQARGVAEPWLEPQFIEAVTRLQIQRLDGAQTGGGTVQFHDRSVICTLALAEYLKHPVPAILAREAERIVRDRVFQQQVFFVRSLGFMTPTAARRITFEEALRFEQMHEDAYRLHGFQLIFIEVGTARQRADAILQSCGLPAKCRPLASDS
jgi:predicted ATPase